MAMAAAAASASAAAAAVWCFGWFMAHRDVRLFFYQSGVAVEVPLAWFGARQAGVGKVVEVCWWLCPPRAESVNGLYVLLRGRR